MVHNFVPFNTFYIFASEIDINKLGSKNLNYEYVIEIQNQPKPFYYD
jgi:hypothetical protein